MSHGPVFFATEAAMEALPPPVLGLLDFFFSIVSIAANRAMFVSSTVDLQVVGSG